MTVASDAVLRRLHDAFASAVAASRYLDRYYRDQFDRFVRPPIVAVVQALINRRRPREDLGVAEERILPVEEEATRSIFEDQGAFTRSTYANSIAERVGNTKTYGVVRGTFEVLLDLPGHLRHGVFAAPRTYPVWVRFGGPGPHSPPDMHDAGLLSVGIKLMGVDGPKLLDDEQHTQDFTLLSSPTFTTPDVIENVKLQRWVRRGLPAFYFLDTRRRGGAPRGADLILSSRSMAIGAAFPRRRPRACWHAPNRAARLRRR